MAHTTNTTNTTNIPTTTGISYESATAQNIRTDTDAMAIVRKVAEANPSLCDKDYDAVWEVGEADCDTIFCGYLWDAVVAEVGDMGEDTEELLACAITDFFADMLSEGMAEDIAHRAENAGYDECFFADIAFAIAEGCDYDEECQKATDAIAEALGLATTEDTEDPYEDEKYCRLNEFVNEMVSAQMVGEDC